jgi:hypothetical protein
VLVIFLSHGRPHMQTVMKRNAARLVAEALVITYMGLIAYAAHISGIYLLLFPELAALSHDVITRPRGKWASQPWRMIFTPTLTAILGLFVSRHVSYGTIAIAAVALGSLLIIKLLRSAIAPAISAGVLPIVLDERSWVYPAAIFAGLVGLVALLLSWRRYGPRTDHSSTNEAEHSRLIDALETESHDRFWVITLLAFVLVLGLVAEHTGLRLLLFPPLVVMAYEVFGHLEVPGWMARPALFPLVCFLTASIGLLARLTLHATFSGVALTMICSIGILRAFKVHMPPALALGILAFMIKTPNFWYPISVGIGTGALMVCFWVRGYLQSHLGRNPTSEPGYPHRNPLRFDH